MKKTGSLWCIILAGGFSLVVSACSFDYGESGADSSDLPDIIMRDVEYVRVRGGDPQVRFSAESAMRFESRQIMELENFSFEQFDHGGEDVGAIGQAGSASVMLDTGNILMRAGVRLEVDSEDIIIETEELAWADRERRLSSPIEDVVNMHRSDGTNFSGRGFLADVRNRTWSFSDGIEGTYIWEDDDEEEEEITE